jgi:hypothetical protein
LNQPARTIEASSGRRKEGGLLIFDSVALAHQKHYYRASRLESWRSSFAAELHEDLKGDLFAETLSLTGITSTNNIPKSQIMEEPPGSVLEQMGQAFIIASYCVDPVRCSTYYCDGMLNHTPLMIKPVFLLAIRMTWGFGEEVEWTE